MYDQPQNREEALKDAARRLAENTQPHLGSFGPVRCPPLLVEYLRKKYQREVDSYFPAEGPALDLRNVPIINPQVDSIMEQAANLWQLDPKNEKALSLEPRGHLPYHYLKVRIEYEYFEHPRVQQVWKKLLPGGILCNHTRDSHSVTLDWARGTQPTNSKEITI